MRPKWLTIRFKKSSEPLRDALNKVLREYAEALVLALILALVIRSFVVATYKMPTLTMAPTLLKGDFLFSYQLPYGKHWFLPRSHPPLPSRGDVMIFRCPGNSNSSCVRRVVGLPGDKVEVRANHLILNEKAAQYDNTPVVVPHWLQSSQQMLSEDMFGRRHRIVVSRTKTLNFGPVIVPPGYFFALSDNRTDDDDSRTWGPIALSSLQGHAFAVWLSVDWSQPGGFFPHLRWSRLASLVH